MKIRRLENGTLNALNRLSVKPAAGHMSLDIRHNHR
jgi:hypothetical protein